MKLYCILTSAINGLALLALGLAILPRKTRTGPHPGFAWFAFFGAIWSFSYLAWQCTDSGAKALFFCRLLSAAAILLPVTYYKFTLALLERKSRPELVVGFAISGLLCVLSFTSWIVPSVSPKLGLPLWPDAGVLYPAYLGTFFYYSVRTIWVQWASFSTAEGLRRNQLLFLLLTTIVGYTGGATNFFLWYDVQVPPIGNGLVAIYPLGVGYAVIRFRLMDFNLFIARVTSYLIMIVLLSMFVFALVAHFGRSGITIALGFWMQFGMVALVFMIAPWLRQKLDSFVEQRLLGDRLAGRELLRALATTVSRATDEASLLQEVVSSVSVAMGLENARIYTRSEMDMDTRFVRRAVVGAAPDEPLKEIAEDSPLLTSLQSTNRTVFIDEIYHRSIAERREYFGILRECQVAIAVPICGDNLFYGCLLLGGRSDRAIFDDTEVSLLEAVALQIALNHRARQLERRAAETERLVSLGTLAAGLAHEVRTPLTSIQTFAMLLAESPSDVGWQNEFAPIVQRDVMRISNIVKSVGAFAASGSLQMVDIDMHEILCATADILRPELRRSDVNLILPDSVGIKIYGNEGQLIQVFVNLVQNAIQALDSRLGGIIEITAKTRVFGGGQYASIDVLDNGPGIPASILPRIFDPFLTTKTDRGDGSVVGMGLGLAIVKRIIQCHRGEIDVTSSIGSGTIFRVLLPCSQPARSCSEPALANQRS